MRGAVEWNTILLRVGTTHQTAAAGALVLLCGTSRLGRLLLIIHAAYRPLATRRGSIEFKAGTHPKGVQGAQRGWTIETSCHMQDPQRLGAGY